MKNRYAAIFTAMILCFLILAPVGSLADTITILNDDFESTPSDFVKRTTNFDPLYHTSEIIQTSAINHVWQLSMGNGVTTGYRAVECNTKDYNSYIFPSNAQEVTYEADVWIVNNNMMPEKVFIGMNFGYRNRIMRIRFSCDTKEILYQWTTGNIEVPLQQAFAYGRWYHVKVVYHTASERCDVYINGIVQSLGFSTVTWTDANVSVNGYNPLMKFNLVTTTTTLPLVLNNPIKANFDNAKVSYTVPAAPVTGDNSRLGLWISVLMLSVAGAALVTWILKKRHA